MWEVCVLVPMSLSLHCIFVFLFKRWLGPLGTLYASSGVYLYHLLLVVRELLIAVVVGNYTFIDFGRWLSFLELFDSHLSFCSDSLALTASALVLFLTVLALFFGVEYMYREAFINRLLYLLNLFATSVISLFFCYDHFLILFAWECIGLFSFLLVNFYSTRIYTVKAALKTFVFSRISDMFMFISFILTVVVFNSTDLSILFLQVPFMAFHYLFIGTTAFHFLTFFSFCLATSGGVKAAQFLSHVWLPDAMEAPTPASALIHSSTLVVAGIFLIIRFSVLFEFTLFTNYFLMLWGALTLAFGAITASFQQDIKKLVAYSTISQIGYLVCGCGFGCYEEVLVYLIVHALNKALLFICVGYLVHFFSGNTDMRQMGGAYLYSFDLAALLLIVCTNLAGLPYSAGFLGKEFLLFHVLRGDFVALFVRGCWLVSFFFTPVYMLILVFIVMFGPRKGLVTVYSAYWTFNPYYEFCFFVWRCLNLRLLPGWMLYHLQYTIITSRATTYVLLGVECYCLFFGESLFSLVFNLATLSDWIPSGFFMHTKTHVAFLLDNGNATLSLVILGYITLLTASALLFLLNLRYSFSYELFRQQYLLEVGFGSTVAYLALTAPEVSIGYNIIEFFTYFLGL